MKIASLVIGILLIFLAIIGGIICLLLPLITNNHVKIDEALLGFIPVVLIFFLGLVITVVSAIFVIKARKAAR